MVFSSFKYPSSWNKMVLDADPWNEEHYSRTCDCDDVVSLDGILTCQIISQCTSKLDQLPDTKHFVFSRLHLNKKGLADISVLGEYKYFQYVDLSWNHITDLKALDNCNYLMYLNVSHNQLTSVLDMSPPWFLTHVDLSYNKVKVIGPNISNFWSLRHVDLSYNEIEIVEGFKNLKYLRYLNLSHNHIREIENLDCPDLEELYLQFNDISNVDISGFNDLKKIKKIDMSFNKISSLQIFKELYTLQELDVSDNFISNLADLESFAGFAKLHRLNMTNNNICSTTAYRELVIYNIPSLKLLDSCPVTSSEKVAAATLFEPDIFTRTCRSRAKVELWSQLAARDIDADTVPCDQPPAPLVVLVGTFGNGKEEIARKLALKFPHQMYRFKKHTTMSLRTDDAENFIVISDDEFNIMIKAGKFITYYKEVGFFFGICCEELCQCVVESKVGLIDTNLEAALVLKASGLRPFLIFCFVNDTKWYTEILKTAFVEMGSWNPLSTEKESDPNDKITHQGKDNDESSTPANILKQYIFINSPVSYICMESVISNFECENCDVKCSKYVNSDQGTLLNDYYDSSENTMISATPESSCLKENEFKWTWSLGSSGTVESEPVESYLLTKGREFVAKMLEEQTRYVELNNNHPSLFSATVCTDNTDSAVKTVEKVCHNISENRKHQLNIEQTMDSSVCAKFVAARMSLLMKDLLNVTN